MASSSTLLTLRPAGIRPSSSTHRKPDTICRSSQSSSWWTPLFGWSSDPDYIDGNGGSSLTKASKNNTNADLEVSSSRSRFAPGGFTEEKAKQLRVRTAETTTFHDIMYHSAIATRLASDRSSHPHM
ncbi:hypothetical protein IFM89_025067 [Coptis chinensis]|uniref:Uncharacterized protein n=1 Tax=Coptis chinensis TaxID=261450 RepID=A0A835HXW2_9MAGN|nr:hypothetical protein IFM89_025067 [Coptis chinensis]